MHLIGTARLLSQVCLPCAGTGLRYIVVQTLGACLPFVTHVPCVLHDFLFKKKNRPLDPNMACVQISMCGRGFELRQAFAFPFRLRFCVAFLLFLRSLLLSINLHRFIDHQKWRKFRPRSKVVIFRLTTVTDFKAYVYAACFLFSHLLRAFFFQ